MKTYHIKKGLIDTILAENVSMTVENGLISAINTHRQGADPPSHDFQDVLMAPGFVDIQLNGCNGVLFNATSDIESLRRMEKGNLKHGVTSFLPTFITDTDEHILKALDLIETIMTTNEVPTVKGMHLEGPYIAKAHSGAHNEALIRPLDPAMLNILCTYGIKGVLKIITVAPETVTPLQISRLRESGIIVSLGHSAADTKSIHDAIKAGATMLTHIFNGMPPLKSRYPSLLGQAFTHPKLSAGIIADFVHVDKILIKAAKAAMGKRLFAVTDATATQDSTMTEFNFGAGRCHLKDGRIRSENGSLAGSALTMDTALNNLNGLFPLEEALAMCTRRPARAAGIDSGILTPGSIADFILLGPGKDKRLEVKATYLNGEAVYHQE